MTAWFRENEARPGEGAEQAARLFLESRGYALLAANHRTRFGEVDLVMEKGEIVVFVEVRERASSRFGSAVETVDRRKQARIAKAAVAYAKMKNLARRPLRFDIVSIENGKISHLENAFVPQAYYL